LLNPTSACQSSFPSCEAPIAAALDASGRAYYDIAHPTFDPFPPPQMYGFLTSSSVLAALGVPVNYTAFSRAVNTAFETSSDWYRGGFLEHIAHLLRANVSVHLVYGDRDAACNWMGGTERPEHPSLTVRILEIAVLIETRWIESGTNGRVVPCRRESVHGGLAKRRLRAGRSRWQRQEKHRMPTGDADMARLRNTQLCPARSPTTQLTVCSVTRRSVADEQTATIAVA
jgi:hypothetical protein